MAVFLFKKESYEKLPNASTSQLATSTKTDF